VTATPTESPTATPTPGVDHLTDPDAAKAADACQRTIEKAGIRFVGATLKRLGKCARGAVKCIQTKPGDAKCLEKATGTCTKELAGGQVDESKLRTQIAAKCQAVAVDDLFAAPGLGYEGAVAGCDAEFDLPLDDVGSVALCLARQHRCRAEQVFGVHVPRVGELLAFLGLAVDPESCLPSFGGSGDGLGDPSGTGKAFDACDKTLVATGAKLLDKRIKTFAKCVDLVFACLQKKPGDDECLVAAETKCDAAMAKLDKDQEKRGAAIGKKCGASEIAFAILAAPLGGNLEALASLCADLGVDPLASLADYQSCLLRRHACVVDDLLQLEAPRAAELLAIVGRTAGGESCP
jgi:hypothetical protein